MNRMQFWSVLSLSMVCSFGARAQATGSDVQSAESKVEGQIENAFGDIEKFDQELDPVKAEALAIRRLKAKGLIRQNVTAEQLQDMEATPEQLKEDLRRDHLVDNVNLVDAFGNPMFMIGMNDQIEVRVHRDTLPQYAEIFYNGIFIKSYWVSTGAPGHRTPTVTKDVYERKWNRTSQSYGGTMTGAMMYSGGYGVHMTPFLSKLGSAASHGCVRMEDAGIYEIWLLAKDTPNANITINILSGNVAGQAPAGKAPYQGGKLQKIEDRSGKPAGGRLGNSEV